MATTEQLRANIKFFTKSVAEKTAKRKALGRRPSKSSGNTYWFDLFDGEIKAAKWALARERKLLAAHLSTMKRNPIRPSNEWIADGMLYRRQKGLNLASSFPNIQRLKDDIRKLEARMVDVRRFDKGRPAQLRKYKILAARIDQLTKQLFKAQNERFQRERAW